MLSRLYATLIRVQRYKLYLNLPIFFLFVKVFPAIKVYDGQKVSVCGPIWKNAVFGMLIAQSIPIQRTGDLKPILVFPIVQIANETASVFVRCWTMKFITRIENCFYQIVLRGKRMDIFEMLPPDDIDGLL